MLKTYAFRILTVCLSLLALAVVLEVVLRMLPVHGGAHLKSVNSESPILHYEPDRDFTWSAGPTFHMVNTVHINNYGFVSNDDYVEQAASPLLAVIGDSYTEAFQLPYEESLPGRIDGELEGKARVYSFSVSGAPLSQYLVFAEHAVDTFHADAAVFNITGNDFDESLIKYNRSPGYHYFQETPDGGLEMTRIDFSSDWLHDSVRSFALARYLFINADVTSLPRILRARWDEETGTGPRYVEDTSDEVGTQRIVDSKRVTDKFFDELPIRTGLGPGYVLFVLDAVRPSIYDPETLQDADETYWGVMREYFIQVARERGYEIVDLQELFLRHYRRHGQRFERVETKIVSPRFGIDHHWSSMGHGIAFEGVRDSQLFARFANVTHVTATGH